MTCIVAVTDGHTVVIGGDSAGVGDQQLRIRADEKVFRKDPWGIGFTTSYRMGQILRYGAELPVPAPDLEPDGLDRFFVLEFVPAVREAFEEHGFAKTVRFSKSEGMTEEGQAFGGLFLIGFEGKIFEIREDFHFARPLDPFSAVGHGAQVALGALHALRGETHFSLREKATRALEAAASYSSVVREPFHFLEVP